MSDERSPGTKAWLSKSYSDLRTAMTLSEGDEPHLDTAAYHCQLAAEKAVKAFLHHLEVRIRKTHDITELVELAKNHDPAFVTLLDDADLVSPLATKFRYPDESDWLASPEPTPAEFDEARDAARRIYDFVLSVLPPETHPA